MLVVVVARFYNKNQVGLEDVQRTPAPLASVIEVFIIRCLLPRLQFLHLECHVIRIQAPACQERRSKTLGTAMKGLC